MYPALVIAHSWLRWLVLAYALLALARALAGRFGGRPWQVADDAAGRGFIVSLDIQVLIGLVLHLFLSPFTTGMWSNMAETMGNPVVRFFAVEHVAGMLAATAFAHVGRARIRKTSDSRRRHTTALIFFGVALALVLVSIPWPFMAAGRPLLRGF